MRKVWLTRDKHGPIKIHTELPREVAGSWLSDGPILTINTGELIALLGHDLEPCECSPPMFIDRWIPVDERLPEEPGCWCQVTRIIRNERWVTDSYWSGDYWEHDDVIAWKPLPEPYQPAE